MTTTGTIKGRFIVIDGCEGAGKTTQMKRLKERYGDAVVFTREPGGCPYGESIRTLILKDEHAKDADAETLMLLFWAARAEHLHKTVRPALAAGKAVISDRFDSSTYAYQIAGQGHARLERLFLSLRDNVLGELSPDRYIVMDIDPVDGIGRKRSQAVGGNDERNHFDDREIDFHSRVRQGYRDFFRLTGATHQVVDATPSEDDVFDALVAALES